MKNRNCLTTSATLLGLASAALLLKSFLPPSLLKHAWPADPDLASPIPAPPSLPTIDVEFLRCGHVTIPEWLAVSGTFSFAPRVISHSAVLIRHPRATFLYDTGLCTSIHPFIQNQSPFFRATLGRFTLEEPIASHLHRRGLHPNDLAFALISHLHWDHVSGIPDLPGVELRINRTEHTAFTQGLLKRNPTLVRRLLSNNPITLLDCTGPTYAGFRSSLDLFGDGSLILIPLPGHTPGQLGLFINRANGPRLFLIGDAAWISPNYLIPTTMHPFLWSRVTSDDPTARQTLINLHTFARHHPEIPLIAIHDAHLQDAYQTTQHN